MFGDPLYGLYFPRQDAGYYSVAELAADENIARVRINALLAQGSPELSPQLPYYLEQVSFKYPKITFAWKTDSWIRRLPITGTLIRIDIDPAAVQRDYAADVGILGDAGLALSAIAAALGGPGGGGIDPGEIADVRRRENGATSPLRRKHVKVLDALRAALADDGIVVNDMTQIAYTGNAYFPCARPRSWFHPNGFGTLGYALPAAIGAKLGAPGRDVVCLIGDGGFLFTASELGVAVEMGLPVVIVLWNNDGMGQIRDDMNALGIPEIGVNPVNPDYLKLAEAFGARALRAESLEHFEAALREGFAAAGPTLIEVRQDAPFLD